MNILQYIIKSTISHSGLEDHEIHGINYAHTLSVMALPRYLAHAHINIRTYSPPTARHHHLLTSLAAIINFPYYLALAACKFDFLSPSISIQFVEFHNGVTPLFVFTRVVFLNLIRVFQSYHFQFYVISSLQETQDSQVRFIPCNKFHNWHVEVYLL